MRYIWIVPMLCTSLVGLPEAAEPVFVTAKLWTIVVEIRNLFAATLQSFPYSILLLAAAILCRYSATALPINTSCSSADDSRLD